MYLVRPMSPMSQYRRATPMAELAEQHDRSSGRLETVFAFSFALGAVSSHF